MQSAIRITTRVLPNGKIELQLPPESAGDEVEVFIILLEKRDVPALSAIDIINQSREHQKLFNENARVPVLNRRIFGAFRRRMNGCRAGRDSDLMLELYQRVALGHDLPEHNLKKGDVVTLVDYVTNPSSGENGYVLEIFNAVGESMDVIAVPMSAVQPLRNDEILTVRSLAKAS